MRSRCPNAQDVNCDPWSECRIAELDSGSRRRWPCRARRRVRCACCRRLTIRRFVVNRCRGPLRSIPSLPGSSVRYVCAPQLIRAVDDEVPVDQVDVGLGVRVPDGAAVASAPVEALDAGRAHQPGDALVVDRQAEPQRQLCVHPRPSVGTARILMNFLDVLEQQLVLLGPRGLHPGSPFVVALATTLSTRQVTATLNPSSASSRTSGNTTLGERSPGRSTRPRV